MPLNIEKALFFFSVCLHTNNSWPASYYRNGRNWSNFYFENFSRPQIKSNKLHMDLVAFPAKIFTKLIQRQSAGKKMKK